MDKLFELIRFGDWLSSEEELDQLAMQKAEIGEILSASEYRRVADVGRHDLLDGYVK